MASHTSSQANLFVRESATVRRSSAPCHLDESARDRRHPISRWYLLAAADFLVRILATTLLRPWHVSLAGLCCAGAAVVLLVTGWSLYWAALFVALAWFCDRLDGKLARVQGTATGFGAWLDASLDELVDIGLHAALAYRCCTTNTLAASYVPWLFAAFVAGKYLLMHGIHSQRENSPDVGNKDQVAAGQSTVVSGSAPPRQMNIWRALYHLPGNADVRIHLLLAALLTGWLLPELAIIAAYYNLRWLARLALSPRRFSAGSEGSP